MKKIYDDQRMMLKVCDLYYNSNLTQQQISEKFGISRPTISRIIDKAKQNGIVKIEIINPFSNEYNKIEKTIEEVFGLKEVVIVDDYDDIKLQNAELGKVAASFLERVLDDKDIVGVSMGNTLKAVCNAVIGEKKASDLTFIPMLGGMGQVKPDIHCNQLVIDLARKFKGKYYLMHAPAYITDENLRNILKEEVHIKEVFQLMDKMTVALIAIGSPTKNSTMVKTEYYTDKQIEDMYQRDVVGDVCLQMFKEDGCCDYKYNQNIFGMNIEKLKNIKKSIAVSAGKERVNAIYGAINAKFLNILITNYSTAKALLDKYYKENNIRN